MGGAGARSSPPLLLWSFFTESTTALEGRPLAVYTLYGVFGAAGLLITLAVYQRWTDRG